MSSSIALRGQTSIENQKESQKRPRKQCSLSPSSRSIDRRGTALEFSTRRGTARARNFKSARSRYRADARASARTTGGVVGIEAIFCFRFSSSHSINWRNQAKKSEEEKKLFSCFSSNLDLRLSSSSLFSSSLFYSFATAVVSILKLVLQTSDISAILSTPPATTPPAARPTLASRASRPRPTAARARRAPCRWCAFPGTR